MSVTGTRRVRPHENGIDILGTPERFKNLSGNVSWQRRYSGRIKMRDKYRFKNSMRKRGLASLPTH
ncbi:MAG: hypothetical protein KG012_18305 [Deltaproteobacteria bacterium]|nr:hypothetical protein [Deltaproteobacteria bacterium]